MFLNVGGRVFRLEDPAANLGVDCVGAPIAEWPRTDPSVHWVSPVHLSSASACFLTHATHHQNQAAHGK
jgi:hypothetical protein